MRNIGFLYIDAPDIPTVDMTGNYTLSAGEMRPVAGLRE
jgi:hypothetical protein